MAVRLTLLIVCATLAFMSALAVSQPPSDQMEIPAALLKKLEKLSGSSAPRSCGAATTEEERELGNACMGSAHASKTPFTFAYLTALGKSGIWFAWAGNRKGEVYQIFLSNPDARVKDIFASECTAFEITESKGVHCTLAH